MPNRTVYLPDELDQISRRLQLNLSQVVQEAIRNLDSKQSERDIEAEVSAASTRAQELGIDWADFDLGATRSAAGER